MVTRIAKLILNRVEDIKVMTAQQLYDDIVKYVGVDNLANWYVGIASDIEQRLFGDHAVHKVNHMWIHGRTLSAEHARSVETALIKLGFDGGTGGGDSTTVHVYAFRKDYGTVR